MEPLNKEREYLNHELVFQSPLCSKCKRVIKVWTHIKKTLRESKDQKKLWCSVDNLIQGLYSAHVIKIFAKKNLCYFQAR